MKRIMLLVAVALMVAAAMALSGVAQAKPITNGKADARCLAEAIKTLGPGFNPSGYHFVGGTENGESFDGQATTGPDVFCGFGGNDFISTLDEGDIFLGGAGVDSIFSTNNGTFYGGVGNDEVIENFGIFYGGAGRDIVASNDGTFYGGPDDDFVGAGNPPVDGP